MTTRLLTLDPDEWTVASSLRKFSVPTSIRPTGFETYAIAGKRVRMSAALTAPPLTRARIGRLAIVMGLCAVTAERGRRLDARASTFLRCAMSDYLSRSRCISAFGGPPSPRMGAFDFQGFAQHSQGVNGEGQVHAVQDHRRELEPTGRDHSCANLNLSMSRECRTTAKATMHSSSSGGRRRKKISRRPSCKPDVILLDERQTILTLRQ